MPVYTLEQSQWFPVPSREIWSFVSNPANLKRITPDSMGFDIRQKPDRDEMYEGMMIAYTVRPLFGIPLQWVTEITHIREGSYFVDEQRMGPYALWHHEHWVEPEGEGTRMMDRITYAPPLGWLGRLAHPLLIRPKLNEIFSYRRRALENRFGTDGSGARPGVS